MTVLTAAWQTEIVLRVKHADNPHFAFLMPSSPLHAFFRFLVTENPERVDASDAPAAAAPDAAATSPRSGEDAPAAAAAPRDGAAAGVSEPAQPAPGDEAEPPESTRGVIEKLVAYVGRNGPAFLATARPSPSPRTGCMQRG